MKIRVCKSHWFGTIMCWGWALFCLIGPVIFCAVYAVPGDFPWFILLCGFLLAGVFGAFPFSDWKAMMTVKVADGCFRGYFFGKLCSEVSADRDIYYATFAQIGAGLFILLSNEPLTIPKDGPFCIQQQLLPKQVILPFNAAAAPYLDLKNWHFHADIPLHHTKVSQLGHKYRS